MVGVAVLQMQNWGRSRSGISLGCIDGNRYCLGIDFEVGVRDKLDNAQPKKPLHTFFLRNKLSFDQQIRAPVYHHAYFEDSPSQ